MYFPRINVSNILYISIYLENDFKLLTQNSEEPGMVFCICPVVNDIVKVNALNALNWTIKINKYL
jgi:hypothetical protein